MCRAPNGYAELMVKKVLRNMLIYGLTRLDDKWSGDEPCLMKCCSDNYHLYDSYNPDPHNPIGRIKSKYGVYVNYHGPFKSTTVTDTSITTTYKDMQYTYTATIDDHRTISYNSIGPLILDIICCFFHAIGNILIIAFAIAVVIAFVAPWIIIPMLLLSKWKYYDWMAPLFVFGTIANIVIICMCCGMCIKQTDVNERMRTNNEVSRLNGLSVLSAPSFSPPKQLSSV